MSSKILLSILMLFSLAGKSQSWQTQKFTELNFNFEVQFPGAPTIEKNSTATDTTIKMNATRANAFVSTGDLFMEPDRDSMRYAVSFFSKLDLALFNAPGNHDLEGDAYNHPPAAPLWCGRGGARIAAAQRGQGHARGGNGGA